MFELCVRDMFVPNSLDASVMEEETEYKSHLQEQLRRTNVDVRQFLENLLSYRQKSRWTCGRLLKDLGML